VQELWDVFKNGNDVTFESYYNTGGSGPNPHLCIGAAAPGARVYLTSNCFGNAFTSWQMVPDSGGGDLFYNVYLLDKGIYQVLSVLNTRTGAFVYVEPTSGGPSAFENWRIACPAARCL